MTIIRFFLMLHIVFFLGLTIIQSCFAEKTPSKMPDSATESVAKSATASDNTETVNNGKTNNFDYKHTFYREKKIHNKDGSIDIKNEPVSQTITGEKLLAVVTYTYKKNAPANEFIFTLPLPKEVIYVKGSATNQECVWISMNNGQTWLHYNDLQMAKIHNKRPLKSDKNVTHLQWRIASTLKKGDTGELKYKVIIR